MSTSILFTGTNIALAAGGTVVGLVLTEHVCDIRGYQYRPSRVTRWAFDRCKDIFWSIGKWAAVIGSWPQHLKLERLWHSTWAVLGPVFGIAFSWLWIFKGFYDYVASRLVQHPTVSAAGLAIIGAAGWTVARIVVHRPVIPEWRDGRWGLAVGGAGLVALGACHIADLLINRPSENKEMEARARAEHEMSTVTSPRGAARRYAAWDQQ